MDARSFPLMIAIDGPAASGKSTLARRLAEALGYLYFDTGVLYRAVTWAALQRGLSPRDEAAMTRLASELAIDVRPPSQADGRSNDVWVDGQDVTWAIRSPEVDAWVAAVAAHPGVRQALLEVQRRIGRQGRVVMVGRDIGTVVLPEADFKIYLDASLEERARRRYEELRARGQPVSFDEVLARMRARDRTDAGRSVAPLRPAPDAWVLVTDGLTPDQVFTRVWDVLQRRAAPHPSDGAEAS
ncbi:MAG: (d)CMP kinase [Chloroflexi bacterium]|nr:(d)CMP kinase [Chloroflexota bacterium]